MENENSACFGEKFLLLIKLLRKFPPVFLVRGGGLVSEHPLSLPLIGPKPTSALQSRQEENLH